MNEALKIAEEALKNKPLVKDSQLDRIENKLDKLLDLVGDKEQSERIDKGTISSKKMNVINSNH